MNRMMIWAAALVMMFAVVATAPEANAGLFKKNDCCCKPQKCRQGLFAKMKAKRAAKKCCEPDPCCAPEPTCCEAAPACGCAAPAPACGCAAAPAPACGCEVASTCGCAAPAPACGCETVSCDCLSRRQLRKANRKGQCCGVKANTCSSCSAPVSTCGCSAAPAVQGCSSCAGGETVIEVAPEATEEAAPEAPSAT